MKVRTGYIYHIKDEFFNKINDKSLMTNHENGHARPTYFTKIHTFITTILLIKII